jgi:protein DGCR14
MKNNDYENLRALYTKYSHLLSSTKKDGKTSETPSAFTMLKTPNLDGENITSQQQQFVNPEPPTLNLDNDEKIKKSETLDSFLAKHTSEDNVSFESILHEAEKKERTKMHQSWLFEKEKLLKLV